MRHRKPVLPAAFAWALSLPLALTLLLPTFVLAQTPAGPPPAPSSAGLAYDVAAIRPSKAADGNWSIDTNGNTLSVQNATVMAMLAEAYEMRQDLISGEPRWADSAQYDVQAKILDVDPDALKKLSDAQHRVMLQTLLAERFHLKVHTEIRMLPVYDLVAAKSGLKLQKANGAPQGDVNADADKFQGVGRGSMSIHSAGLKAEMLAHAVTPKQIAFVLSYQVHRTVIDKTGLTGSYDVSLTWAPDNGAGNDSGATDASIFTALQEQLGLKLVAAKGPVKTLVVDHLEAPTEN